MYNTVFEISLTLQPLFYFSCVFTIVSFGFGFFEYRHYCKGKRPIASIFACPCIVPSLLFGVVFITGMALNVFYLTSWHETISAYKQKSYDVVEGEVFVLHKQAKEGHDDGDRISVGGMTFTIDAFSDFTNANAYKQTIAYGGALQAGTYVRICHYKGKILRIDVKSP